MLHSPARPQLHVKPPSLVHTGGLLAEVPPPPWAPSCKIVLARLQTMLRARPQNCTAKPKPKNKATAKPKPKNKKARTLKRKRSWKGLGTDMYYTYSVGVQNCVDAFVNAKLLTIPRLAYPLVSSQASGESQGKGARSCKI